MEQYPAAHQFKRVVPFRAYWSADVEIGTEAKHIQLTTAEENAKLKRLDNEWKRLKEKRKPPSKPSTDSRTGWADAIPHRRRTSKPRIVAEPSALSLSGCADDEHDYRRAESGRIRLRGRRNHGWAEHLRLFFSERVRAGDHKHAFCLQLLGGEVDVDLAQPGGPADLSVGQRLALRISTQNPQQLQS